MYRVVVFPRGLDRMRNKLILFLVSWIFHCQVYGDIDITEIRDSQSDDYGFEIAFNGVKLMKHAPPDFPLFRFEKIEYIIYNRRRQLVIL